MNTLKFLTLAVLFIGFTSCSSDDDGGTPPQAVEFETITNLYAPQETDYTTTPPTIAGDYIKFSFETGTSVTGDDWDIAFRGTTILVNGGESTANGQPNRTGNGAGYIVSNIFNDLSEVNTESFNQDNATSGLAIQNWYTYDGDNHMIYPTAGKVLVIRTHDNKYAKMEITSYYEDGIPNAETGATNFQYYTFNYVYQPNEGVTTF